MTLKALSRQKWRGRPSVLGRGNHGVTNSPEASSWDMGLPGQMGMMLTRWWNSMVKAGRQKSKFVDYVT